ncbi:MAG: DnaJ domain-containing protein [Thermodesulforhabdaceae bacterium]
MECYYKLLGLSFDASEEDIRRSFRRLALKWHPDHCNDPQANERFQKLRKAYETLIRPSTRESYNRSMGYPPPGKNSNGNGTSQKRTIRSASSDIAKQYEQSIQERMKEYFGISWEKSKRCWWRDLRFDIYLTPEQTKESRLESISYVRLVYCQTCMAKPGVFRDCTACVGRGFVEEPFTLEVSIPAECPAEYSIYYPELGDHPSPDMPPGGLIVKIHVVS